VTVGHYENFPVASLLCPAALRPAVRAIYRFARTADDLADEGPAGPAQRRESLEKYRLCLQQAWTNGSANGWPTVFPPLMEAVRRHDLPLAALDDLLDAFLQDCGNPQYDTRAQLLDYCRRSANPIGRLLLALYRIDDAESQRQSDSICTALQLINFWQDPSVDLPRGRSYFPREDLAAHQLDPRDLQAGRDSPSTQALLRDLCSWSHALMAEGAPLALRLPGRIGWELRLVVQGGLRILEKIEAMQYRTLSQRPALRGPDWVVLIWRAVNMRDDRRTLPRSVSR
jgi:hydroxysqualene synthase